MRIQNNTVTNYHGQGMYLRHGEGVGGRADFIVQGNAVSTSVGQEGLFVESGTTSSGADEAAREEALRAFIRDLRVVRSALDRFADAREEEGYVGHP